MNQTPAWAKGLQVETAQCDEWKALAPADESFVFWCLRTGRLNAKAYYAWAKNQFQLAKVEDGYFALPPNRTLWKSIHGVANWSPWMLPLELWDDVVVIGCVEPPVDVQWSFRVAYVLADSTRLKKLWEQLTEKNEVTISPPAPKKETPESDAMTMTRTLFHTSVSETPAPEISLVTQSPDSGGVDEMPLGLNFKLDMSAPAPSDTILEHEQKVIPTEPEAPAGFMAPAGFAAPPPLNPPRETVVKSIPRPPPMASVAAPPPPPLAVKMGPVDISHAPEQIDLADTQDICLAWCFRQLRTRFSTAMVLLYSQNSLQPWKWDLGMKPNSQSISTVSFETPSLFRVAARTLRPYHGFVIDNPTHAAFFQNWGFANLPKHVTGVPVVINGSFRGLFLCIGSEANLPAEALEYAEMIADKTVQQLEKIDSPFSGNSTAA